VLANTERFSEFSHQKIRKKICSVSRLKICILPIVFCYTTLSN